MRHKQPSLSSYNYSLYKILSSEVGVIHLQFTTISIGTEWTEPIAKGQAQALCNDSCRSIYEPLLKTTKAVAGLFKNTLHQQWLLITANPTVIEQHSYSTAHHLGSHLLMLLLLSHASFLGSVVCLCHSIQRQFLLCLLVQSPVNQSRLQRNQTNSLYWRGKYLGRPGCKGPG